MKFIPFSPSKVTFLRPSIFLALKVFLAVEVFVKFRLSIFLINPVVIPLKLSFKVTFRVFSPIPPSILSVGFRVFVPMNESATALKISCPTPPVKSFGSVVRVYEVEAARASIFAFCSSKFVSVVVFIIS